MTKLVAALRTVVRAISEDVAKEFLEQYPKPTQENLEKFVARRSFNDEEVKELLYDINKQGTWNLSKPQAADSLDDDIQRGVYYEFTTDGGVFRLPEKEVGNLGISAGHPIELIDEDGDYLADQQHIIDKVERYAPEARDLQIQSVEKGDGFITRYQNEWVAEKTKEGLIELLEQLEQGEMPHELT